MFSYPSETLSGIRLGRCFMKKDAQFHFVRAEGIRLWKSFLTVFNDLLLRYGVFNLTRNAVRNLLVEYKK